MQEWLSCMGSDVPAAITCELISTAGLGRPRVEKLAAMRPLEPHVCHVSFICDVCDSLTLSSHVCHEI